MRGKSRQKRRSESQLLRRPLRPAGHFQHVPYAEAHSQGGAASTHVSQCDWRASAKRARRSAFSQSDSWVWGMQPVDARYASPCERHPEANFQDPEPGKGRT